MSEFEAQQRPRSNKIGIPLEDVRDVDLTVGVFSLVDGRNLPMTDFRIMTPAEEAELEANTTTRETVHPVRELSGAVALHAADVVLDPNMQLGNPMYPSWV